MCLWRDSSVRQHSKGKHSAPFDIQTPSRFDLKIVESKIIMNFDLFYSG